MKDNTLVIIPSDNKEVIIEDIRNKNNLKNYKFMTFDELINNHYFSYKEDTIIYIMNKYKVNYNIAKIYLDNIYYCFNKDVNNDKINNLKLIKSDLEKNGYLIKNKLFIDYLKNTNVVIYNFDYLNKYQLNIINEIKNITNVDIINNDNNIYTKDIYECNNKDEEIDYVANKIISLINDNISLNDIKLVLPKDYYLSLERIFKIYNLPIIIKDKSLYNTYIGSNLLNNLDNAHEYLDSIKDIDIKKKIINILNKYINYNYIDIKEVIKEELKKVKIYNKLNNYIEIIDLDNYNTEGKYIFLLGFNQKYIPNTYKNEDYLEDNIKELLNIDTSYEMNTLVRNFLINKINNIKNLIITYDKTSFISSLNNELNYNIISVNNNYSYSNNMNKLKLSKMLDNYYKYGSIDNDLDYLYSSYKDILYKKYNNKYNKIDKHKVIKYLNNKLLLSYSSIDNYTKCSFKYYLSNILKIRKEENTFSLFIGNLFHYVLSICFNKDFDFELEYDKYIFDSNIEFSNKEKYFLNKLKNNLIEIISVVKEQHNNLLYKDLLLEEKIYINLDNKDNINTSFMGIIDKVIYNDDKGFKKIAIIDYKTGNVDLNLDNLEYGINMQLPIYIYLAKRSDKLNNSVIIGFYLQRLLSDDLKLLGYSTNNEEELNDFEPGYKNSSIIKSLKMTNNGFSTYSKLFDNDKLNEIDTTIDNIINNSKDNIIDSNFDINPKRINNENISCKFCKYKDICYMKEEDIVNIESDKEGVK